MARVTRAGLLASFRDLSESDASEVVRQAAAIKAASNLGSVERHMEQIDKLIEGFGVEAFFHHQGEGLRNFASDPDDELIGLYVNTGDTYSSTILWDARKDRVMLTTWGDFVEGLPRRMTRSPGDGY